jgi:hypothetical protein
MPEIDHFAVYAQNWRTKRPDPRVVGGVRTVAARMGKR